MAAGLQCWDASGKLLIDLTDTYLQFVQEGTIGLPPGATSNTLSISGVSPDTHVVLQLNRYGYGGRYAMIVVQGGIRIYAIDGVPGTSGETPANYEVYKYA